MSKVTIVGIGVSIISLIAARSTEIKCPCSDESLCEQVSIIHKQEVFAFSVNNKSWRHYDWGTVTTIAESGYSDPDLLCYAHSRNVRIVRLVNFPVTNLTNAADRTHWVSEQVQLVRENFLDGVNVDFEDVIEYDQPEVRDGLTALVKELTDTLRKKFSHPQVTFDVAWSPKCIDSRCYDYVALAKVTDFIFVMSYDTRSQIYGDCIAWANTAYNVSAYGVDAYLKLGIPPQKLVLGLPWYGYNYPCKNYNKQNERCEIRKVPFRAVPCSDAAGSQKGFSSIMSKYLPLSHTGRLWDGASLSPYFSYKDNATGSWNQVWYDDVESLSLKTGLAKKRGLRGTGVWEAEDLDYSPHAKHITAKMWEALRYDVV